MYGVGYLRPAGPLCLSLWPSYLSPMPHHSVSLLCTLNAFASMECVLELWWGLLHVWMEAREVCVCVCMQKHAYYTNLTYTSRAPPTFVSASHLHMTPQNAVPKRMWPSAWRGIPTPDINKTGAKTPRRRDSNYPYNHKIVSKLVFLQKQQDLLGCQIAILDVMLWWRGKGSLK